ncbi:MAG: hypothetical protein J6A28_03470 [Clostridia bacterium]|nr:hypothetical protein [Clostridia bacterium]
MANKKTAEFAYSTEVPFREGSHCFMVKVEGKASLNADGCRATGDEYARFYNALEAGIKLYSEEFLANDKHAELLRKEFFEVIEPTIKKSPWGLKDVDLGITSVKIAEMNWLAKEGKENTSGWVEKRNEDFARMYPQAADAENEI